MPFPWKKVKSRRISQLVNDHLHISQKRRDGSSLVVETGFPTSLIDLFIKNREKMKKPSRKKFQTQPISSPINVHDPMIEGSPISSTSSSPPRPPPPSLAGSPPPQNRSPPLPPPLPPSGANKICAARSSGVGPVVALDAEEERGGDGEVNGVLIEVLKIFVVVVLALATKRLTVGITISAVLLLFLECVGKHCRRLSKPCVAAKAAVMPLLQIGVQLLRHTKLEEMQVPPPKPVPFPLTTSAAQEIQVLESTVEIQPEREITTGYEEIELVEMEMKRQESISDFTDYKRKSRRDKIKSKMKKIVPKKFRGSKKEQSLQSPPTIEDAGVTLSEEQQDDLEESEDGSISSSVSSGCYNEEKDDKSGALCSDRRLSDVIEEETHTMIEEKGHKIEAAVARRYMLLCLIVLAGLIGGRPFALVLTLIWFLMLKLGQALHMIMSLNVKSG